MGGEEEEEEKIMTEIFMHAQCMNAPLSRPTLPIADKA